MVEVEERLRLELGQIGPLNDDGRDWQDVLARVRASGPPRAQTTTRRRRIVGFAIAAFLLATSTYDVAVQTIGRENVPFGSTASSPNIVKKQFADLAIGAPPQMTPGVLAAQARQVGTFTVAGTSASSGSRQPGTAATATRSSTPSAGAAAIVRTAPPPGSA